MHAAAGKSTLPVLSNVLLMAQASHLKISATDLEIAIVTVIEARIAREAEIMSVVFAGFPSQR